MLFFLSLLLLEAVIAGAVEEEEEAGDNAEDDALGSMLAGFVAEWNPQKVGHARELRRIVRAAGRQARDLSMFLYPLASTASLAGQVVSFIPNIVKGLVTGVSSVVDVFGMSISFLGGGLGYSAAAVEKTGRSIQNLSSAMPAVVTGVLLAGTSLLFMFPNLQSWMVSGLASTGLMYG
ncbi:uncharacterized protein LOC125024581 isoform X2 [Penaeus chinensis]|uniref:uncharacterized protein LOC125024581 isoform X2 n=1 Tax=Penaeus chinensis TaxID=139456 RepID=UPI001FB758DC|nr:uncharacterized protein LOC125024581 isoform X2 [Penaeus chinensis]